jgi:hypothetical protein
VSPGRGMVMVGSLQTPDRDGCFMVVRLEQA